MSQIKVVETEDGDVLLGSLEPTADPGVLAVRTGFSGRPVLIHVDEIDSVTDADDDPRVHAL